MRATALLAGAALCGGALLLALRSHERTAAAATASVVRTASVGDVRPTAGSSVDTASNGPVTVYAHNLRLRKGPQFRVYVRWIRGEMLPTRADVEPSLDAPDSFVLEIQKGVIHANIGDVANVLNAALPRGAPLTDISLQPEGDELKLRGIAHKGLPLPVELTGRLSPTPDGRVQFHVSKIDVLKLPVKALLGTFHLQLDDLVSTTGVLGIAVRGNDIFFDTQRLSPPPHIHGTITRVSVAPPDVEVVYGDAPSDEDQLAQWHNFFRLRGGTLGFGRLTMRPVDLTMIDASQEPWFDLDLVNYQAQLASGTTRITAQTGLEIYMPGAPARQKHAPDPVTVDWLKNKRLAPPQDVHMK